MLLLISQLSFLSVTDLYFFDSGQGRMGLGIALPPMWEEWRPSLQRVMMSSGESRLEAVRPSLLGVVPSRPVASMAAVAMVMVVIPMAMAEVGSEVTLVIPPPIASAEERRETGLPASPGGGTHGSPSWSELEGVRRRRG